MSFQAMSFQAIDRTARPLLIWLRAERIPLSLAGTVMASDPTLKRIGVPVGETQLLAPAQWQTLRAAIKRHRGTGRRKGRAKKTGL